MQVRRINIKKNGKRLHELLKAEVPDTITDLKMCSIFKCECSPFSTEGFKRPCVFCNCSKEAINSNRQSDCPEEIQDVVNGLISVETLNTKNSEW